MHWFIDPIKNHYADFEGRIGRQEFWMFILFSFLLNVALEIVSIDVLAMVVSLALFIPNIALASRRLHDTGRSGWWQLLWLIPIVGWIIIIVWLATKTEPIDNMYGTPAVPKMGPEGETPDVSVVSTPAAPIVEIDTPASMVESMDVTPDVPASSPTDSSASADNSSDSK
jgi:uncharacterized membrane protein YhaH (DUF805 family)